MLAEIWTRAFSLAVSIVLIFFTPSSVTKVNPDEKLPAETEQEVTIMSYNLKFGGSGKYDVDHRAPLVKENIEAFHPDSFGTQECNEFWFNYLSDNLEDYEGVGIGRDGNRESEASPVFYLKDKYELVDSGTFWLSETPDEVSKGWDGMYKRVCTYAVLKDKETGFEYAHFNAHFDHLGIAARLESVSVVSSKIAEKCGGIPVVFTGDLNDEEGSVMYNRILESGMRDSKFLAEETMSHGTYHGYSKITELMRVKPIDFCFVNDMCTGVSSYFVDTQKYDGIYPSDHHPIIIELTLAN